jgi:DNA primase
MKDNWVDFKAVKATVTLEMALDHYAVNWLRRKGDELRGRCPIHQGDGEDAFHANLEKNAFHCFSCKARGNVLDFIAAMEKCSVRDAALKLAAWFTIGEATTEKPAKATVGESESNRPLTFQLKDVDTEHEYLKARGISRETAATFGVGYFAGRGSMSGRVVIPIHNEQGELVAYAGRALDGDEPKYKLPAGFHKSQVLFNLHRVTTPEVIVVEGFFDCMKVWQSPHPFVVALMGSSFSEHQEKLVLKHFKKVTLMLDGDAAGREAAHEIAKRLIRKIHVRIVDLPDGVQPDQLDQEGIGRALGE